MNIFPLARAVGVRVAGTPASPTPFCIDGVTGRGQKTGVGPVGAGPCTPSTRMKGFHAMRGKSGKAPPRVTPGVC